MKAAKSSEQKIINGFPCVTRDDLLDYAESAIMEVESMETLFASIVRLASGDTEIAALAAIGKDNASILHNDMDVIRERAAMAGLIGELA